MPAALDHLRAHLIGQRGGVRAGLLRVAEGAHAIKLHLLQEAEQGAELLGALAGEAHDEAGAQRDVRHGGAQITQDAPGALGVGRAAHAAQGGRVGVLERHVKILDDLGARGHHLDQTLTDAVGVGVHQAHPDVGGKQLAQLVEQRGEPVLQPKVAPVVREMLGHQHDLTHAGGGELLGLGEDGAHRLGGHIAFEAWDGAEGAAQIAAVGDF